MRWSDPVQAILGGDLTAGLAYITPAGGAVVTAVAPIGLSDREAGTVGFTTSRGFGRKLERIERDPRVALAYHAREHGFCSDPGYVLVQGQAAIHPAATPDDFAPHAERFLGAPRSGVFWDRWLAEYYRDRLLVSVSVARVSGWPAEDGEGAAEVIGAPAPAQEAEPQDPPKGGTGPRVDVGRAARRLRGLGHHLLAYRGADGYPDVVAVRIGTDSAEGIELESPVGRLPRGGRRAGLLGHDYRAQLIGLRTRQHTGWLNVDEDGRARYAPHTEKGFNAPANKTLLLLANGGMAKLGVRRARRATG